MLERAIEEYKRHISMLERSIEEHKRLVRKRDKELEQIKNEFENNVLNASSLTNKVFFPSVADLGFRKGRALFSKGGAVVGKNHFLRSIRGSINSFFVRFCWEKSENFFVKARAIAPSALP
jgi:hypothetical protein